MAMRPALAQRRRRPPGEAGQTSAYEAVTRGITVRVTPSFMPEQSDPERGHWVWAYAVEVLNGGPVEVQLVSRHWIITDAINRTEEVKGPGVVGEQPELKPGESFRYTSACPLHTPSGLMRGSYRMVTPGGDQFDVVVPLFSLDLPEMARRVN